MNLLLTINMLVVETNLLFKTVKFVKTTHLISCLEFNYFEVLIFSTTTIHYNNLVDFQLRAS